MMSLRVSPPQTDQPHSPATPRPLAINLRHVANPAGQSPAAPQSASSSDEDLIQVHIPKSALRYLRNYNSSADASFEAAGTLHAPMMERLSKALQTVNVNVAGQDSDDAVRTAVLSILFDVPADESRTPQSRRATTVLSKWRLNKVNAYIDANIARQITLAEMASVVGMSRMYFASQFRGATGIRPHDHLLRRRIEYAQKLLVTTSEPLAQIALSSGFQTQSHFTTVFKKIARTTPYKWRRDHKQDW
jgi:AraC family transcriptional regulator